MDAFDFGKLREFTDVSLQKNEFAVQYHTVL